MSDQPTLSRSPETDPPADRVSSRAETEGPPGGASESPPGAPSGYELLEKIGSGGMGIVYRAREVALNRHVALKILHPRYPTGGPAARRFVDEAAITGQLQHPGIPPVHQVGALADGRPFLAMKLIKGSTLEDLLTERANPAEDRGRFLAVFEQVCQAVGYAHARGVIHRDLKPSNVMVGAFGEVQVMDWGLAKALTGERAAGPAPTEPEEALGTEIRSLRDLDSATQAGSILGTPAFMPPEQAGGEIEKIDTRADVFGLGAILCVVLTGAPPYSGRDPDAVRLMAIRGQLGEGLARLDGCGAEPELVALCERCLAADPAGRPADAGEVARAVAGLRAEAEERAKRAEIERARAEVAAAEQRKRRRVQAALGLAFGALVVLGGAFLWWAQHQRQAREAEAGARRTAVERDVNRAVADAVARFERAKGARSNLTLWAEARAAALQADARAAEAGAPDEVRERTRQLIAEIEQTEKNRRLVAALLEIQAGMGDAPDARGDQDFAGADDRYARAFREYGTDPFALTPEEGARVLAALGGDVRVELAAAIDDWGYVRFVQRGALDDTAHLFRVTRVLDPDPMRNRVRDLVAARDQGTLSQLAEQIDPAAQPVQTVNLVAVYLYWFRGSADLTAPIRFLHRAQPDHASNFQINQNLSHCFARAGQYAEAVRYSTAAAALRPQSANAWRNLAWAFDGLGRRADALAAYRRAAALAPRNAPIHVAISDLLARGGDPDGARGAFGEALQFAREATLLDPGSASARKYLGLLLHRAGDLNGALAEFSEAHRLDPNRPGTNDWLAHVHIQNGSPGAALPFAEQAVALDPRLVRAWWNLGRARLRAGDPDGALTAFRAGLARDPTHSGCAGGLAAAQKALAARDRIAPPPRGVTRP